MPGTRARRSGWQQARGTRWDGASRPRWTQLLARTPRSRTCGSPVRRLKQVQCSRLDEKVAHAPLVAGCTCIALITWQALHASGVPAWTAQQGGQQGHTAKRCAHAGWEPAEACRTSFSLAVVVTPQQQRRLGEQRLTGAYVSRCNQPVAAPLYLAAPVRRVHAATFHSSPVFSLEVVGPRAVFLGMVGTSA